MDRENQKHGLAHQSMKTSQVPYKVFIYLFVYLFIYFVLYSIIQFGPRTLPPSGLSTNSLLPILKFEFLMHCQSHTLQGTTSNTLPYGEWPDNERVVLSVG